MDPFHQQLNKARNSKFHLWLLNRVMLNKIPFNKPHRIEIVEITDDGFKMRFPYKKSNLNHLNGLHACGLATISEYVAGLTLLRKLGSKKYRLIMESIEVKYFYQGKTDAITYFELSDDYIQTHIAQPLETQDAVFADLRTEIKDLNGNLLCESKTRWQLKKWDKVKTKV